jgi:hypothetical protein
MCRKAQKMSWRSVTGFFMPLEMLSFDVLTEGELAPKILGQSPVMALRMMIEIMHLGDQDKFSELLKRNRITAHWRRYATDLGFTQVDFYYATELEGLLAQLRRL